MRNAYQLGLEKKRLIVLVEVFGFDLDINLARLFLFPVLAHPRFPALARRRIAASECQARNLGISNANFLRLGLREKPHHRFSQRSSGAPIENISFDGAAVFQRNGDVAAIVKSLLKRLAKFLFAGGFKSPALEILMLETGDDFKLFNIDGAQTSTSSPVFCPIVS